MRWHGLFLAALASVVSACVVDPGPSGRRSCADLGWVCGVDDNGASCGFCGTGTACSNGVCVRSFDSCLNTCSASQTCVNGTCVGASTPCVPACSVGQTCVSGVCIGGTPTCSLSVFNTCVVGGSPCCAPTSSGTPTYCSTTTAGTSFCAPQCANDAYCDSITGTTGRWTCGARRDGIRVCFPR